MNILTRLRNVFLPEKRPLGPDDVVDLAESDSEAELQLWHDILRRNAVEAVVVNPPSSLIYGGAFNAGRIKVRNKDLAKARELLGFDASDDA
jgi:hypothetical protein